MTSIPLELKLPEEKYALLVEVARALRRDLPEVVEEALMEWLEREERLARGRKVMRELGRGLDRSGLPDNGIAREHDNYLYDKP